MFFLRLLHIFGFFMFKTLNDGIHSFRDRSQFLSCQIESYGHRFVGLI